MSQKCRPSSAGTREHRRARTTTRRPRRRTVSSCRAPTGFDAPPFAAIGVAPRDHIRNRKERLKLQGCGHTLWSVKSSGGVEGRSLCALAPDLPTSRPFPGFDGAQSELDTVGNAGAAVSCRARPRRGTVQHRAGRGDPQRVAGRRGVPVDDQRETVVPLRGPHE